ncbi:MAG: MvaI/BcnI family restriction endonuclease, partial [Thermoplasmata archaeon]
YGYPSKKDPTKLNLHVDLYGNKITYIKGKPSLKLAVTESKVNIVDINNVIYGGWSSEDLRKSFEKVMHRVLLVKADSRIQNGIEEFNYNEAWVLYGFSFQSFIKLIQEGTVKVELRIGIYPKGHKQAGKIHDHGTGFRVLENDLQDCFAYRDKIL